MTTDEKKAAYKAKQRAQEAARREALGMAAYQPTHARSRVSRKAASRPAHGSQEWAETYRDDLGESPDF